MHCLRTARVILHFLWITELFIRPRPFNPHRKSSCPFLSNERKFFELSNHSSDWVNSTTSNIQYESVSTTHELFINIIHIIQQPLSELFSIQHGGHIWNSIRTTADRLQCRQYQKQPNLVFLLLFNYFLPRTVNTFLLFCLFSAICELCIFLWDFKWVSMRNRDRFLHVISEEYNCLL